MILEISSSANPQFRRFKSLLSSKGIKSEGLFLLSGEKLVKEYLKNAYAAIEFEILPPQAPQVSPCSKAVRLTADLFHQVDELGTDFNLLVLKTPELAKIDFTQAPQGLELLCPLGDPQNVGALLRSAEAFAAAKVILLEEAASPFLPKSVKASAGSVTRVPLFKGPSLKQLPRQHIVALDTKGTPISRFKWPCNIRLLVGEEGLGVGLNTDLGGGKSPYEECLSIPTQGVESLNAVMAATLALYEYSKNRK